MLMRPLRTKTKVLADELITESPFKFKFNFGSGKKVSNLLLINNLIIIVNYGYRTLNRHRFVGRVY
jgi:hypothetical protein